MKLCLHQRFKAGGRTWRVVAIEWTPPHENKKYHIIEVMRDPVAQETLIRDGEEMDAKVKRGEIKLI